MNLTSLRKSYSKLISSFKEAGVVLNESQQENLDTFMLMLEKKMTENRDNAIRATKKIVTEQLEAKYKEAFESIVKHMQENSDTNAKIKEKTVEAEVTKRISEAVDNYLDLYMEEVLPKKAIVDYDRLKKLESVHESLKNVLSVNETSIETKKAELDEQFNKEKKTYEDKISELNEKLNESMKKQLSLNKELESQKATAMLEKKLNDLPEVEAKMVKESLKDASTSEIKMKFKSVLESVRKTIQEGLDNPDSNNEEQPSGENPEQEQDKSDDAGVVPESCCSEKNLDEAINDVINADEESNNTDDGAGEVSRGQNPEEETSGSETGEDQAFESEYPTYMNESVDEGIMMDWIRMAKGSLS